MVKSEIKEGLTVFFIAEWPPFRLPLQHYTDPPQKISLQVFLLSITSVLLSLLTCRLWTTCLRRVPDQKEEARPGSQGSLKCLSIEWNSQGFLCPAVKGTVWLAVSTLFTSLRFPKEQKQWLFNDVLLLFIKGLHGVSKTVLHKTVRELGR